MPAPISSPVLLAHMVRPGQRDPYGLLRVQTSDGDGFSTRRAELHGHQTGGDRRLGRSQQRVGSQICIQAEQHLHHLRALLLQLGGQGGGDVELTGQRGRGGGLGAAEEVGGVAMETHCVETRAGESQR